MVDVVGALVLVEVVVFVITTLSFASLAARTAVATPSPRASAESTISAMRVRGLPPPSGPSPP